MKKLLLLSFISFTQVFGAAQSSAGAEPAGLPTDLELARANQYSYQLENTGFERDVVPGLVVSCGLPKEYEQWDSTTEDPVNFPEDIGFQVVTLVNESTKNVIIAVRGTATEKVGNLLQDLAIIGAQLTHQNPEVVLKDRLDAFLRFYYGDSYTSLKKFFDGKFTENYTKATGGEAFAQYADPLTNMLEAFGYHDVAEAPKKSIAFLRQAMEQALRYVVKTENLIKAKVAAKQKSFFSDIAERASSLGAKTPEHKMLAGYNVTITGHSLGGFIAQIVGAVKGYRTVTFNGPGARAFFSASPREFGANKVLEEYKNIRNLVREDDVVGNFGAHLGSKEFFPNWFQGIITVDFLNEKYNKYVSMHTNSMFSYINPTVSRPEWIKGQFKYFGDWIKEAQRKRSVASSSNPDSSNELSESTPIHDASEGVLLAEVVSEPSSSNVAGSSLEGVSQAQEQDQPEGSSEQGSSDSSNLGWTEWVWSCPGALTTKATALGETIYGSGAQFLSTAKEGLQTAGRTVVTACSYLLAGPMGWLQNQLKEIPAYILDNHSIKNFADDMDVVSQFKGEVSAASNAACVVQPQ